jgi:hypothetical protein
MDGRLVFDVIIAALLFAWLRLMMEVQLIPLFGVPWQEARESAFDAELDSAVDSRHRAIARVVVRVIRCWRAEA